MTEKRKVNGFLLVSMPLILVMWGSFAAVSKLTLRNMDSFQLQFWMFGSAAAIMTVSMLLRRKLAGVFQMKPREVLVTLLCGLPSYLYYLLYTLSLSKIPAVEASMLNYLFPVMILLFAIPINGERLSLAKGLSLALGVAGTVFIVTGGRLEGMTLTNLWGDLLALGGAVCWGIFSNLGKWNKQDMESSVYLYTLLSFVLSAVSLACFSRFRLPSPMEGLGALWLSLSNIVLTVPLWLRVMKAAPASLVSSVTFLTPFVTLLFIMLLIGEQVKPEHAIGLVIVAASIAVQFIRLPVAGRKAVRIQAQSEADRL